MFKIDAVKGVDLIGNPKQRIVTFANGKGGCGKTLLAINMALAWMHQGKRVVVIDVDKQAHATWSLGVDRASDFYQFMMWSPKGKAPDAKLVEIRRNLWVLPGNEMAVAAEVTMSSMNRSRDYLRSLLLSASPNNIVQQVQPDIIIIDTPSQGYLNEMGITAADLIVAPTPLRSIDADGLTTFAGMIMEFAQGKPRKVNIVPNRYDARTTRSAQILNTIREELESAKQFDSLFGSWHVTSPIYESVDADRATEDHQALFEYSPGTKAAQSVQAVAQELLEALEI